MNINFNKIRLTLYAILFFLMAGCSMQFEPEKTIIRMKGSDTLLPLAKRWAVAYMQQNPNVSIYVEGGGTATGARALAAGTVEICTASRPLRAEEVKSIAENHGAIGFS
ncbi:MAG: hypothetical protein DWQ10_15565, partial [Calditrichaeota bacterium]